MSSFGLGSLMCQPKIPRINLKLRSTSLTAWGRVSVGISFLGPLGINGRSRARTFSTLRHTRDTFLHTFWGFLTKSRSDAHDSFSTGNARCIVSINSFARFLRRGKCDLTSTTSWDDVIVFSTPRPRRLGEGMRPSTEPLFLPDFPYRIPWPPLARVNGAPGFILSRSWP